MVFLLKVKLKKTIRHRRKTIPKGKVLSRRSSGFKKNKKLPGDNFSG
jgi:hypothetical protein